MKREEIAVVIIGGGEGGEDVQDDEGDSSSMKPIDGLGWAINDCKGSSEKS